MQKIILIAQGVLELSHRENADDDDDDNDDDDSHQGWIIVVRDGMYSVADKKKLNRALICIDYQFRTASQDFFYTKVDGRWKNIILP